MKNIYFKLLFISIPFSLISCNQHKIQSEQIIEEKIIPQETFLSGTVVSPDTYLSLPGRDNKMHKIISAAEGKTFDAVYSDEVIEEIIITENISENEINEKHFYKIIYDNVDFYIEKNSFIPESSPAVILKNSYAWKTSTMEEALDFKLILGKEIAVKKNEENSLVHIYFWDKIQKNVRDGFIKREYISELKDDIEVIKIIDALKKTTRATERNKLFYQAEKYNPSIRIKAELEAQKTEVVTNSYKEVLNALPGKKYKVNINELMTVDQSKDPFQ